MNCREIEADYHQKISDLESGIERQIKVAKDKYSYKIKKTRHRGLRRYDVQISLSKEIRKGRVRA